MTVSTVAPDRDGDIVRPEGMRADQFLRNPVLLWAHDYSSLPIGTVTALNVLEGKGVEARFRWLDGDPMAARVRNAWDQGVVRAASIGFKPLTWEPLKAGYDITGWELLELSLVPVPANPEAVRTLKGLGLIAEDAYPEMQEQAPPEPPAEPTDTTEAPSTPPDPEGEQVADPPAPEPLLEDVAPVTKRGRVFSAANERELRQCLDVIGRLLSQLEPAADEADDEEPIGEEGCGRRDDEKAAVAPPVLDVTPTTFDLPSPPRIDLAAIPAPAAPDLAPARIAAALRVVMAEGLSALVRDEVSAALDRLRGTVR